MWAYSTKILLANAPPWRQGLCKGIWCMPGLKSNSTQALWWLIIFANSYLPLEGFINRFSHGFTNFNGLEGRQLQLNPCYYWLAHKDGSLQTNQGHYWRLGPCWDIINMVVRHHGLLDLIVTNQGSLFTSKFWSSLCYFFGIKRRLSTAFHL